MYHRSTRPHKNKDHCSAAHRHRLTLWHQEPWQLGIGCLFSVCSCLFYQPHFNIGSNCCMSVTMHCVQTFTFHTPHPPISDGYYILLPYGSLPVLKASTPETLAGFTFFSYFFPFPHRSDIRKTLF